MMSQYRGGVMRGRMGAMAPAAAGGAPAMSDLLCTSRMIAGRMTGSAETNAIVRGVSEPSNHVFNNHCFWSPQTCDACQKICHISFLTQVAQVGIIGCLTFFFYRPGYLTCVDAAGGGPTAAGDHVYPLRPRGLVTLICVGFFSPANQPPCTPVVHAAHCGLPLGCALQC